MAVCVTWVSYANLYILMALCGNAVAPMHQQQGCRGLALGHRYRAWAMAWCLTGTRPLSISKMTLCIPMKLGICIAWKYQYVWHMSVICKILYLVGLLWDCRVSSALAVEMLQPFIKLLMCMWKYSLPPLVKRMDAHLLVEVPLSKPTITFFEYSLWIILSKPWILTAEIPWYLQIYVLGPVTGIFPGIQPMSWADREPAPDQFLSGFGTLCCV